MGTEGPGVRDAFPQLHALPPARHEVIDQPVRGVRHNLLGELVLQQSHDESIEDRAEANKQDPGKGS